MSVRWRALQPGDITECVEIVATHPVIGPRYGSATGDLSSAWSRILGSEAATMVAFEDLQGSRPEIAGVGVAVFVHEEFVRELKSKPFWVGPHLARRIVHGDSPLLSGRELREANCSRGLTLVCWEGLLRPGAVRKSELQRTKAISFIENYRGYFFREIISSQLESAQSLQWTLETGGMLWDAAAARYLDRVPADLDRIVSSPHVVGAVPELEARRPGTWIGALFDYRRPQMGFTRAEQRLLAAVLSHEWRTDEELAPLLAVSPSTIKKMWLSIYRRAAVCLDARNSSGFAAVRAPEPPATATRRGREKRRRLLTYLHEHPEELRPVSRAVLRHARATLRTGT